MFDSRSTPPTVRRLRSRLIAVVALLLALAFVGTNLVSYQVSRTALKRGVVERELPLTGDTIYSEIQADLVRPVFVSSLMAHDTFVRDWVLAGEQNPEQMRRFLDEIRTKYGFFTAFFVSEATRRYYHFSGISKQVREDEPRDIWFFRVRRMEQDYEINVDPNQQQDDRITVFINFRVMDFEGNFIGAIGVGLELDTLANVIERYRGDFRRHVFFVERSGRITLHPDREIAYRRRLADLPGLGAIAADVAASDRGTFEYEADDGVVLLTTRYIPELDWVLVVEQREAVATAAAGEGVTANFAIGLVAILLTGLAIAFAVNGFQRRLEFMATTDGLTALSNRQVFDATLAEQVERAHRSASPLSLIMIDLDHFKQINDRHGHLNGDRILAAAGRLLREGTRRTDTIARWGGEEFALLAFNCDGAGAVKLAETLRRRIAEELRVDGLPDVRTTASFGIATLADADNAEGLVARADRALYRAKAEGRDRVVTAEAA